ncbi:hypothetical protein T310_5588 [Rasamsonia emersonii CBS 393.64]|uniref:Uncharacterized protein n=1 Tax=Rasamsonia emersonii (strain ATCC 16479 / CBS 393.64 / IMI 116815) TaxID=1408163 RepID=A0A0F4YQL1_RASE3|nr:hypothetical protein T310_5588 [Rasamsonia emersonii CBS 393.64]KKA20380.1 hypothetical protein T310_5588 [Rasamsonia emersonii CBS 393.64]
MPMMPPDAIAWSLDNGLTSTANKYRAQPSRSFGPVYRQVCCARSPECSRQGHHQVNCTNVPGIQCALLDPVKARWPREGGAAYEVALLCRTFMCMKRAAIPVPITLEAQGRNGIRQPYKGDEATFETDMFLRAQCIPVFPLLWPQNTQKHWIYLSHLLVADIMSEVRCRLRLFHYATLGSLWLTYVLVDKITEAVSSHTVFQDLGGSYNIGSLPMSTTWRDHEIRSIMSGEDEGVKALLCRISPFDEIFAASLRISVPQTTVAKINWRSFLPGGQKSGGPLNVAEAISNESWMRFHQVSFCWVRLSLGFEDKAVESFKFCYEELRLHVYHYLRTHVDKCPWFFEVAEVSGDIPL